jgi:hypothetical protein
MMAVHLPLRARDEDGENEDGEQKFSTLEKGDEISPFKKQDQGGHDDEGGANEHTRFLSLCCCDVVVDDHHSSLYKPDKGTPAPLTATATGRDVSIVVPRL